MRPRPPIAPAWITSATASGIVMKKRVISGVGDRHRPAPLDLAAEERDHAAGRVEHVAEPDGDEPRRDVVAVAVRADDPLAERLRLPVARCAG